MAVRQRDAQIVEGMERAKIAQSHDLIFFSIIFVPLHGLFVIRIMSFVVAGREPGLSWHGFWAAFDSQKPIIMITKHKASFAKNASARTITVVKEIDAPLEQVWKAWTTAEQLDKWWGPAPWKAVTKSLDFKEGGSWVYKMQGPKGEEQWDKVNFTNIHAPNGFSASDLFTDEKGNKKSDMPSTHWKNSFTPSGDGTRIESVLSFSSKEDMDKILQTGFEEGFSKGLDQLDDLLVH